MSEWTGVELEVYFNLVGLGSWQKLWMSMGMIGKRISIAIVQYNMLKLAAIVKCHSKNIIVYSILRYNIVLKFDIAKMILSLCRFNSTSFCLLCNHNQFLFILYLLLYN